MIFLILAFIFVLIAFILYKMVYLTIKKLDRYQKEFMQKGFKVLRLKFVPFGTIFRKVFDKNYAEHQDCHYSHKYQWSKYDIVINNFFDKVSLQIVKTSLIRQFFELQNDKIIKKYKLLTEYLKDMMGQSILLAQGQKWKNKRKLMQQLLNFSFIKTSSQKIDNICKRQISKFHNKFKIQGQQKNGKAVAQITIQQMLQSITSTIITDIFFGASEHKCDQIQMDGRTLPQISRVVKKYAFEHTFNILSILLGPKFVHLGLRQIDREYNKQLKLYRQFTRDFVIKRIKQIQLQVGQNQFIQEPKDFIQAYYNNSVKQSIDRKTLIQDLVCDFSNLYTAGTGSAELGLGMFVYYVCKHPQVKEKLRNQIKSTGINVESLNSNNIKNLIYLDAVIYETMRLYQTVNGIFPRQLTADVSLGGVRIQKGDLIVPQSYPVQYNQNIYQNADKFIPERWIDAEGKLKSIPNYCWNSFGNGIRNCIGKQLSMQEMRLFGAYFLGKYEIEFQTLDLKMTFRGFSYASQPLKVKFWERS